MIVVELKEKELLYLKQLLQRIEKSFDGLSSRWDDLRPKQEFNVKISEDFHLGYIFGVLESILLQIFIQYMEDLWLTRNIIIFGNNVVNLSESYIKNMTCFIFKNNVI